MNVYFFGNEDVVTDSQPLKFLPMLKNDFKEINFVTIKPNQDLPDNIQHEFYLVDTVQGIDNLTVLDEKAINNLSSMANASVHDYDLGFQLKYLKKLGKINKIKILGIPQGKNVDYDSFHSSFKKFVAQDIQGS